jgi:hypothetical protein
MPVSTGMCENGRILRTDLFSSIIFIHTTDKNEPIHLPPQCYAEKQEDFRRLQTNIQRKAGNVVSREGRKQP